MQGMRKWIYRAAVALLLLSALAACGGRGDSNAAEQATTDQATTEETTTEQATEAAPAAETTAEESADAAAEEPAEEEPAAEEAAEETTEEDAGEADAAAEESSTEESTDESADAATEETATEDAATEDAATEEATDDTAAPDEEAAATEPAAEPRVFFRQPTDNAIIPPDSTVLMGVEGLTVEPAGEVKEGAGHLHILVDADFIAPGEVIPKDDTHLHFGDGAIQAELTLEPGVHILRLQFADGNHIALEGDQYRDEIVVRVAEDAPEQSVRFVTPTDGAVVPPTFEVVMAATGLVVEPAGEVQDQAGHLHILVDTDFVEAGEGIAKDEQHLHFGDGQTSVEVTLEPGEHTLRLQFADGNHIALEGDQYRDEITVTVDPDAPARQVMFISPQDGDTVEGTFPVQWAAGGLIIEPAGVNLADGHGHLHVLIDTDFIEPGQDVPMDDQHLHFGGGQTATELTLEPGEHTLRLQMADGTHTALEGDEYRDEITITVE